MPTKYTVSVNIQRDANREIHYIKTPNANRAANQIANDFKKGTRSFTLIGSYGTGKSSFLWALEQSLKGRKSFFNLNLLNNPKVEFINIIGEYRSMREVFAEEFRVKANRNLAQNILSEVYNRYHDLGKKGLLFLVIDEFGKFLEYAAKNNPEDELYFIQQLAEFANNDDYNIVLLTTVHQNFDAYAFSLPREQRQEWTKVKGRFKEITFNEPVEQLLYLASEHMEHSREKEKSTLKDISKATTIFTRTNAFTSNARYVEEIADKLYPLDLMAANVLTLALQRYGQNERSLFSFLESSDHTSLSAFNRSNGFYSLDNVYDYLIYNFYSYINSKDNREVNTWSGIKAALEFSESVFDSNITNYSKLIKTIGLLSIFASAGGVLDRAFLENYAKICLGIEDAHELIQQLEARKVILYRKYDKRYIIFGASDLDIQFALEEAGSKVSEISDVSTLLKKYHDLPPIMAKAHAFETGTPRLFEYRISELPIQEIPEGEIDGFINLVFNEHKQTEQQVQQASENCEEAILYGFYRNSKVIKDLLFEIEKTKKVIEENGEDKVAIKELNNILLHQRNLLNHKLLNQVYGTQSEVRWYSKGLLINIPHKRAFNQQLSSICTEVYKLAPKFNNELVNKHKLSSQIGTAKKSYFMALTENWGQQDIGFTDDKFPAEKTIYLSLLKQNGLQPEPDQVNFVPQIKRGSSFKALWDASNKFLDSAKKNKRRLDEFTELLSKRPFKLKQGLIDFWIPSFLFLKRDDFALFGTDGYIADISDQVLELIVKNPDEFEIKTFDVDGVKLDIFNSYRHFLSLQSKEKVDNQTFIETIKPFLVFYRSLPDYTRYTKRLSKEARAIRDSISLSKDPENIFFSDFPQALGYSFEQLQQSKEDLKAYTAKLQVAIRDLRGFYDMLVKRFEDYILDIVGEDLSFEDYKAALQKRYKKLRLHLLLPQQHAFVQRLNSAIDDRELWLDSMAQATVGTPLKRFKDEDEPVLHDKFKATILELDSLTTLSKSDFDENKEDVVGVEISGFEEGVSKKIVRLPKNKKKEVQALEQALLKAMGTDKSVNIVALANILKKLFK